MFYRIYVEVEIGHDLELYTILESKYHWIGKTTTREGIKEYVFKVSCLRYKEFKQDLMKAVEMGYVKRWFEA